MGMIDRLPGIGKKVAAGKYYIVSMLNKKVEVAYNKAIANFKVLGMSLVSGVPLPKVVKICENFFNENKKESKFSDEMVSSLASLFARIELGEFEVEDGVWVKEKVVPYLQGRKRFLKAEVIKKTLR